MVFQILKFMKKLAVIDYVDSLFSSINLEKTCLIACQHLLPACELLITCLMKGGMLPQNIFVIGKCYSTNPHTVSALAHKGIYVSPLTFAYDSHLDYVTAYRDYIRIFLTRIIDSVDLKQYEKILILDDGGLLHLEANELLAGFDNLGGVEQTSKGSQLLSNSVLDYPVINVARSKTKLGIESDLVAKAVTDSLLQNLSALKMDPQCALVLGNGYIGQSVAMQLKTYFDLIQFDIEPDKSALSVSELKKAAGKVDLIVGCSGSNTLETLLQCGLMNRPIILASASSLDIEFGSALIRTKCEKTYNCHAHLRYKELLLLNSGFPVNFSDATIDRIPIHKLQITIGLLLLGIFQVFFLKETSKKKKHCLLSLDDLLQDQIVDHYESVNSFEYEDKILA